MSAEEGIVHTELVESYPDILGWNTDEAWYVSSAENVSSETVLHDHLDGSEELFILSEVVSSPVGAELLGAEEEGASQDMGSASTLVTSDKSTVALSLLGGAISVMEVTMLDHFAVVAHMLGSDRHSLGIF